MSYLCVLPTQPHSLCTLDGLFALTGTTPDISIMLHFIFYQPVFYATHDQHFPLKLKRGLATGLALVTIVVMP